MQKLFGILTGNISLTASVENNYHTFSLWCLHLGVPTCRRNTNHSMLHNTPRIQGAPVADAAVPTWR